MAPLCCRCTGKQTLWVHAREAMLAPAPAFLFQPPSICCMIMSGMESASAHDTPLKATAKCSIDMSGSRMRTSDPVKYDGS